MPDAFISITTSWASGVGSSNCISSSPRSPVNTTPRMASSVCSCLWSDHDRKNVIGKGRTESELRQLTARSPRFLPRYSDACRDRICDLAHKGGAQASDRQVVVLQTLSFRRRHEEFARISKIGRV